MPRAASCPRTAERAVAIAGPSFLRALAAAGLLCLAVAGCATGVPSQPFEATLDGAQEVPPVATAASGRAEAQYNRATNILRWRVSHTGLSGPVTGAHIHGPAGPGQNAGIIVPLGNPNGQPITGEARITPEQWNQLDSGQWYVNLHTARNPGGEIRGQLRPQP